MFLEEGLELCHEQALVREFECQSRRHVRDIALVVITHIRAGSPTCLIEFYRHFHPDPSVAEPWPDVLRIHNEFGARIPITSALVTSEIGIFPMCRMA